MIELNLLYISMNELNSKSYKSTKILQCCRGPHCISENGKTGVATSFAFPNIHPCSGW